jgi:hypothetical protein
MAMPNNVAGLFSVPFDFPLAMYQAVHERMLPQADIPLQPTFREFAGGWNAVVHKFKGMTGADDRDPAINAPFEGSMHMGVVVVCVTRRVIRRKDFAFLWMASSVHRLGPGSALHHPCRVAPAQHRRGGTTLSTQWQSRESAGWPCPLMQRAGLA